MMQFEIDKQEEQQWRDCVVADFKSHQRRIRWLEFMVFCLTLGNIPILIEMIQKIFK